MASEPGTQPHDTLFRAVLATPDVLATWLPDALPESVAKRLQGTRIHVEPARFVLPGGEQRETDLLLSARDATAPRLRLLLVVEHQSHPDPFLGVRLATYMAARLDRMRQDRTPRPWAPLHALVVYQGQKRWSGRARLSALVEGSEQDGMLRLTPHFVHVSQMVDRLGERHPVAGLAFRLLAAAPLGALWQAVVDAAPLWYRIRGLDRSAVRRHLYDYIGGLVDTGPPPAAVTVLRHIDQDGDTMGLWKQQLLKQGFDQGRREGIERGRREGIERGRMATLSRTVRKAAALRWPDRTADVDAAVEAADADTLQDWVDQLLTGEVPTGLLPST